MISLSLLAHSSEASQKINSANQIYQFNPNNSTTHHSDSEIYKISSQDSMISQKKNYQHINSINEIYQSLQDDQTEKEVHQDEHVGKLARAGRVGRTRRSMAEKLVSPQFLSILLSILLLYFVSYKLKIGQQWSQLKKHFVVFCRKAIRERLENRMVKELESKICDWHAKYIARKS